MISASFSNTNRIFRDDRVAVGLPDIRPDGIAGLAAQRHQADRADQHQGGDPVGATGGDGRQDVPAERGSDEMDPRQFQGIEQRFDHVGERRHARRRLWALGREAVAGQVDRQGPIPGPAERRQRGTPSVRPGAQPVDEEHRLPAPVALQDPRRDRAEPDRIGDGVGTAGHGLRPPFRRPEASSYMNLPGR